MKFPIKKITHTFIDSPYNHKIGILIYFMGCIKGSSGNPCKKGNSICHNPDLWIKRESEFISEDELIKSIDQYISTGIIDYITYTGGEPLDSEEELYFIMNLISIKYPKLEQIVFTHYTKIPERILNLSSWIKHGEYGENQYYINTISKIKIEVN